MNPPALVRKSIEQLYRGPDQAAGDVDDVAGPVLPSVPVVSTAVENRAREPVGSTIDRVVCNVIVEVVSSRRPTGRPMSAPSGIHFRPAGDRTH